MKPHRFKVVEYASFYAIVDSKTGEERSMSDGVDSQINVKKRREGKAERRTNER